MSQPRPTDPIGSIGWTERTGGVLTARECLTLARPLLRGELTILAGRLAMVLRMHSGRRSSIDPASLVPSTHGATHQALVDDRHYAALSARAIEAVVRSVRTGAPLAVSP